MATMDRSLPGHVWPERITVLGLAVNVRALAAVLLAFGVTRLLVGVVIFVSSATIPMRSGPYLYSNPNNLVLDGLVRDDSWWYYQIATGGYNPGSVAAGVQGNTAFFPLYPLAVRVVLAFTGNAFIAGLLVSNLAFLGALGYLYALTRYEYDDETAARAVFYLAAAPTAVFFSAMYTESLFLLMVLAAFYYARRGRWDWAAVFGALASATRNTGVLLAAALVLEGFQQQDGHWLPAQWTRAALWPHLRDQLARLRLAWRSVLAAACVPVGLLAYMVYLANAFGDPLSFIHVQATWGRNVSASSALQIVAHTIQSLNLGPHPLAGQFDPNTLLNVLFTLAALPLVVLVVRRMRWSYGIYTLLTFLVPLASGTVGSMTRYVLMLAPVYMLLAHWGRRSWVDRLVLGVCLPFLAYMAVIYSHWYFAG